MDYIAVKSRVAELAPGADPLTAEQLDAVWSTMSAETVSAIRSTFVNERTVLSLFDDPAEGEAVLDALTTAAAGNSLLARVVDLMKPAQGGVDVALQSTRDQLDALVSLGVLTADQATALKAPSEVVSPKWPGLTVADLVYARSL